MGMLSDFMQAAASISGCVDGSQHGFLSSITATDCSGWGQVNRYCTVSLLQQARTSPYTAILDPTDDPIADALQLPQQSAPDSDTTQNPGTSRALTAMDMYEAPPDHLPASPRKRKAVQRGADAASPQAVAASVCMEPSRPEAPAIGQQVHAGSPLQHLHQAAQQHGAAAVPWIKQDQPEPYLSGPPSSPAWPRAPEDLCLGAATSSPAAPRQPADPRGATGISLAGLQAQAAPGNNGLACTDLLRRTSAHGPPPVQHISLPASAPALPAMSGSRLPQGLQQPSGWPQPDGYLPGNPCRQHHGQVPNPFPLDALLAGAPAVPEQQGALCQPEGLKADLADSQPGVCIDTILPMSDDPVFAPLLDELLSWP